MSEHDDYDEDDADEEYDDELGDDDEDDDDVDVNTVEGATALAVLEHITKALVLEPDEVEIEVDDSRSRIALNVQVSPDDMGRVIGRRGRVANAIRTVVRAAASRDGVDVEVDFVD